MQTRSDDECRSCLGCGALSPNVFLDLGRTPLANSYLDTETDLGKEETFPLAVGYCEFCQLVQLSETVPPERMFSEYAYYSSFSNSFLAHAQAIAQADISRFALGSHSLVLEIASNDGYLLQYFKQRGIGILGVDPAANLAEEANRKGIPTLCRFFGEDTAPAIIHDHGQADLVLGNNVLAHVPGINGFLKAVAACLKPDGAAVFEFPYLRELLDKTEFDTIYHEHVFYYSLSAIQKLARRTGLELWDVTLEPVQGSSLRVFLQHPGTRPIEHRVDAMLNEERKCGLTDPARYASFGQRVRAFKNQLLSMLGEFKRVGKRVGAYGAPAKGNTLLNYCGIGRDLIEFTVDRNPYKQGKLLPGSHLPILPPEELLARMPDYALILPWNIADEIVGQQTAYLRAGGRFIVAVPSPRLIEMSTAEATLAGATSGDSKHR
jgi:SAM-dependent methyltransferase